MERYVVISTGMSYAGGRRCDNIPASLAGAVAIAGVSLSFRRTLASCRRLSRSAISSLRDCWSAAGEVMEELSFMREYANAICGLAVCLQIVEPHKLSSMAHRVTLHMYQL